jgi:hypothetical protein
LGSLSWAGLCRVGTEKERQQGSGKSKLETEVKVAKFNDDFFSFYWLIFMGISKERPIFIDKASL